MEETFRYLAIRDPRPVRSTKAFAMASVLPAAQSDFYKTITKSLAEGQPRKALAELAKTYQAEHANTFKNPYVDKAGQKLQTFVRNLTASETGYDKASLLDAANVALDFDRYKDANVAEKTKTFLQSNAITRTYANIVDCVLSQSYAPSREGRSPVELNAALKLRHLLGIAANNEWFFKKKLEFDVLSNRIAVVLPAELLPRRPAHGAGELREKEQRDRAEREAAAVDAQAAIDAKIDLLKQALAEVKAQTRRRALVAPKPLRYTQPMEDPPPLSTTWRWLSDRSTGRRRAPAADSQAQLPPAAKPQRAVFSADAYQAFSNNTKTTLKDIFGFTENDTDPVQAAAAIENEISRMYRQYKVDNKNTYIARVGNVLVKIDPKVKGARVPLSPELLGQILLRDCAHYSGIGELRIVRQELIAYELKDIAHVENVLTGESKERGHRRLDRTEQVVRELEEAVSETEQESASTERHELETKSQKEAEQQVHVDGSLTVSGSYGPTVDFSTTVSGGFSSSTSTSSRRASNFAREVTEKAIKRIKQKTVTERRRTTLREIEETNKHGVVNTAQGANHVRGVYRWLDKIYRARVFTYGLRHMFEFVVPEPAAFYLSSLKDNDVEPERLLQKPDYGPDYIDRDTWAAEASAYNAQGVRAPPPQYQWVAHKFDVAEQTKSRHTHSEQLAIPQGHKAIGAIVNLGTTSSRGGNAGSLITVHDQLIYVGDEDGAQWVDFGRELAGGTISITYRDWNYYSYALGIDVLCEVTIEHEDQWRLDTYSAIMEAYNSYEADYQAKLDALAVAQGVNIEGRNPAENVRIIRRELQRNCLSAFTEDHLDGYNMFGGSADDWKVGFATARAHGSLVRFFQHAFEWENMTYVFYPYFWGRFEKWTQILHTIGDPDPAMSQFLQAGAARVQIPVRPGFELAVARYCQDKTLPQDAESPVIGDDLYVPIIDEILESLDAPDGGVEVGDPWEVAVPTSLVLLEDAANLKGFRDRVFGGANGLSNIYP